MGISRLWRGRPRQTRAAPRVPDGQRVYAIGDIHGCDRLLAALLRRIEIDSARKPPAHVVLVFLGDYIDRGLGSARVLRILQIPPSWADETVALKGNHEAMLDRFLSNASFLGQWRHYGGLETLASFRLDVRQAMAGQGFEEMQSALLAALSADDQRFLASLALWHVAGDYFFCHAGVRPGVPLEQQSASDLLWIRDEFLASETDFGRIVVHGHSPVERPEVCTNRINVDTGAYATGCLTCVVLEDEAVGFLSVTQSELADADGPN